MATTMLAYEVLTTKTETILRMPYFSKSGRPYTRCTPTSKYVYSELLDENLNFKNVTSIEDNISKIFIFELDYPMYTMSGMHNIGLKDFKDAYLVIEIFNMIVGFV